MKLNEPGSQHLSGDNSAFNKAKKKKKKKRLNSQQRREPRFLHPRLPTAGFHGRTETDDRDVQLRSKSHADHPAPNCG